jgi:predicted deacylase
VIEGEVIPARDDQVVVNEIGIVRPVHGGWIETFGPENGEPVTGGTVLGQIVSPYTFETLETLRAPFANGLMIMQHPTRNLVQPGEYGFLIGNLDDVVDEAA